MTISLAAWQAGLIELVQGDAPTEDVGLVLTRAILRSWRTFRVESCAPLTLSLFGPSVSGQLLNRYLDTTASPSSFLAAEGLLFLDFVDRDRPLVPHAASVVALERGVLMARLRESPPPAPATVSRWLWDPSQVLGLGRGTAVVSFRAEPAAILRALLLGQPVPPEGSGAGYVLCAPGLNDYMTQATVAEANLLACLDQPRSVGSLLADGHDENVIRALATARALEPETRRAAGRAQRYGTITPVNTATSHRVIGTLDMEAFRSRWQRTPSKFDFGLDLILDGLENTGATIRSPTPSSQPNDKRSQPVPPNG